MKRAKRREEAIDQLVAVLPEDLIPLVLEYCPRKEFLVASYHLHSREAYFFDLVSLTGDGSLCLINRNKDVEDCPLPQPRDNLRYPLVEVRDYHDRFLEKIITGYRESRFHESFIIDNSVVILNKQTGISRPHQFNSLADGQLIDLDQDDHTLYVLNSGMDRSIIHIIDLDLGTEQGRYEIDGEVLCFHRAADEIYLFNRSYYAIQVLRQGICLREWSVPYFDNQSRVRMSSYDDEIYLVGHNIYVYGKQGEFHRCWDRLLREQLSSYSFAISRKGEIGIIDELGKHLQIFTIDLE
jgi:hypothetical protein